jgi:poly-gamma-glutamate synthesis protein (capsule biosynthesis protein)
MLRHVSDAPKVDVVNLFMAGDVMTGRGVDQILPRPSAPQLARIIHER